MDIIDFDNKIFLNYNGLESLGFGNYLDKLYEELLSENQIFNKGIGHIFINQKVHVLDEPKKFIKLGLEPKSSLFKRSLELRIHLFEKAQTDFLFTGFFRIENLSRLAAEHRKKGLRLTPSDFSYVNGIGLHSKIDFKLFERDINVDHKDVSYFLEKKNTLVNTKTDNLRNSLYFPLDEIIKRLDSENYDTNKLTTPEAEVIFIDGICLKKPEKIKDRKTITQGDNRNFPSTEALINQVQALVSFIKQNLPDDYDNDTISQASKIKKHLPDDLKKDESIATALQELNPGVKGLSYSSISKVVAKKNKKH